MLFSTKPSVAAISDAVQVQPDHGCRPIDQGNNCGQDGRLPAGHTADNGKIRLGGGFRPASPQPRA